MTSATLTTRSMAYRSRNRAPLHQRIWDFVTAAGSRRAGTELHRHALLQAETDKRIAEIAGVRAMASRVSSTDPRFASDLLAAADCHERENESLR